MPRKIEVVGSPPIYLAHGASGNAASMRPHVAGLHRRGLEGHAVQLPVGLAEKAVPRYREQVLGAFRASAAVKAALASRIV